MIQNRGLALKHTAIVTLKIPSKNLQVDLEVPLQIAADRVVRAIFETYGVPDGTNPALLCEEPIALLCGRQTLEDLGVRDGSILSLTEL